MPIELGKFEQWLMDHFFLLGKELFDMHSGQPVKFYRGKGGWKFTKLDYFGWKKKNVSEHRMKFLPAHRWLSTTVDHDNGVRDDNHLDNLVASTPALQALGATQTPQLHLSAQMRLTDFRPMAEFDPEQPALVHDRANDLIFEWSPEWRENYKQYAKLHEPGVVAFDGLLLDGWWPLLKVARRNRRGRWAESRRYSKGLGRP
jgi:hypothetical protein